MNKKSLANNFIFNIFYQLMLYVVPLVITPYLSRVLGVDGIGRYSYIQSIVSYFVLFATLGSTLYGQKKIAQLSSVPREQGITFWEIVQARLLTTLLFGLIYLVVIVPYSKYPALYMVAGLEIISVLFDIGWLYQGCENFQTVSIVNSAFRIAEVVLVLLVVRSSNDLWKYILIHCGTLILGYIGQWLFCPVPISLKKEASWRKSLVHIRAASLLFVSQVAIQIYTVLDKTMIGLITQSDAQNGYYEQAQKLIRVPIALIGAIGTVVASRVAMLYIEKKQDEMHRMIELSFQIVCALCVPMMIGIIIISKRFVPIFYGDGFEPVGTLLRVLSPVIFIISCSNVIGIQFLVPTNREKLMTKSVIVGSLVNFALNSVFIAKAGALGACVASVLAESCVTAVQMYYVRKEYSLTSILRLFIRYLLYSAPMGVVGILLCRTLANNLVSLIVIVLGCVIVYGATLVLMKDAFFSIVDEIKTKKK